jgi:uncharacterized protein with PIN domain
MFWDSSALVPLLTPEERTAQLLDGLKADPDPAIWWASPVECRSAIERRRREGDSAEVLEAGLRRLETLLGGLAVVAATEQVRGRAGRMLAAHPLRAAGALQLAAALVWSDDSPGGEAFVCLDDRLRSAAAAEGFELVPPAP